MTEHRQEKTVFFKAPWSIHQQKNSKLQTALHFTTPQTTSWTCRTQDQVQTSHMAGTQVLVSPVVSVWILNAASGRCIWLSALVSPPSAIRKPMKRRIVATLTEDGHANTFSPPLLHQKLRKQTTVPSLPPPVIPKQWP